MKELADYAADVAPHVDRLVLAVHRQSRAAHAAGVATWRDDAGLAAPGLLINLRPFINDGVENADLLGRLHRYEPPGSNEAAIGAAVEAGVMTPEFEATDRGRELAARLTELQRATINELWADSEAVFALVEPLTTVVDNLPRHYPGEEFMLTWAFVALDRPKPPGPFLVHHLLTVLRYHRADCHSEVLTEAELTPGEAARLDEVWRQLEGDHHGPTLEELVLRGLVTSAGELTDDGRTYRQAIEDETNSFAATAWSDLDDDVRTDVLQHLASLPDHPSGSQRSVG